MLFASIRQARSLTWQSVLSEQRKLHSSRSLSSTKKKSPSSKRWLDRQSHDPFVKLRASQIPLSSVLPKSHQSTPLSSRHGDSKSSDQLTGDVFLSRSAFKLIEIDDRFKILRRGNVVIDLGAAPGGWSQVAASRVAYQGNKFQVNKAQVYALDVLDMDPPRGVHFLQGSVLEPDTLVNLRQLIKDTSTADIDVINNSPMIDVVLSDMMAPISGISARDNENSIQLCRTALKFAITTLRPRNGCLVIKYFSSADADKFKRLELKPRFDQVFQVKPKASRAESKEGYWVCLGFKED